MDISSQNETYNYYTPSGPPSRISINGVLDHRSSKETIQLDQRSISNSSFHTNHATTAIDEDMFGLSRQRPLPLVSRNSSDSSSERVIISDDKSFHSLNKTTSGFRNQSLSTVSTTHEHQSNRNSGTSFIPMQNSCSPSLSHLQDEAESFLSSTPSSSRAIAPSLITDPSPSQIPVYVDPLTPPLNDGDYQPLANMEISTADTPSIRPASFPSRPTERVYAASRSRSSMVTVKNKKGILGFMTNFLNSKRSTGLPKGRRQPLQDSGISESHLEGNPPAIMEAVKSYHEGGGDVSDNMANAPATGSSQLLPTPGAPVQADQGASRSDDESFVQTVSLFLAPHSRLLTIQSGWRGHLQKRLALPAHRRLYPRLTSRYHISLCHLHSSHHNLTLTGRTPSD